jgi:hypothetical protein
MGLLTTGVFVPVLFEVLASPKQWGGGNTLNILNKITKNSS